MQYIRRSSRRMKPELLNLQEAYPHDLQLYRNPPRGDVSLGEFHELAMERLKVLRIVDTVCARLDLEPDMQLATVVSELRNMKNLTYYVKLLQSTGSVSNTEMELKARRKDHISHFILHFAYCLDEELKHWLIGKEIELFKLRFANLSSEGVRRFLEINDIQYKPISQAEKESIKGHLISSTSNCTESYIDIHNFYKVPHEEVADLVQARRVYLHLGYAYIPDRDLISVLVTMLKIRLASALAHTKRSMPILSSDPRVASLLKGLKTAHARKKHALYNTEVVPIESLDALSKTSFPLCMRFIHESFRINHHLKHFSRLYYSLFLKGIGVQLDDIIRFWRAEFTQKMDVEKFEKKYVYGLRHTYGKEGKRTNYTPYSCMKIIQESLGVGEVAGCPFKEADDSYMRKSMFSYGIHSPAINEILDLAKKGHYQIACTKYFEAVHKCPPPNAIVHPNLYFKDSQQVLNNAQTGQLKNTQKNDTKITKADDEIGSDANDLDDLDDLNDFTDHLDEPM